VDGDSARQLDVIGAQADDAPCDFAYNGERFRQDR